MFGDFVVLKKLVVWLWQNFNASMLERLVTNELRRLLFIVVLWGRVHLKLFLFFIFKISDRFWLAHNIRDSIGFVDIYLHFIFFLLKIIINYKCSDMSRKNYYLDVRIQVACDDFLIYQYNDTWYNLICFFYILFNSFSDTCIFKICN